MHQRSGCWSLSMPIDLMLAPNRLLHVTRRWLLPLAALLLFLQAGCVPHLLAPSSATTVPPSQWPACGFPTCLNRLGDFIGP